MQRLSVKYPLLLAAIVAALAFHPVAAAPLKEVLPSGRPTVGAPGVTESLRRIGSPEGFKPYDGNPILKPGPTGRE